jgi:large subunit ribosomal protein L4
LKALELENKKSLFVLCFKNVYLSSRNLKAASVVSSLELSTYAILNANNLAFEFFGDN